MPVLILCTCSDFHTPMRGKQSPRIPFTLSNIANSWLHSHSGSQQGHKRSTFTCRPLSFPSQQALLQPHIYHSFCVHGNFSLYALVPKALTSNLTSSKLLPLVTSFCNSQYFITRITSILNFFDIFTFLLVSNQELSLSYEPQGPY